MVQTASAATSGFVPQVLPPASHNSSSFQPRLVAEPGAVPPVLESPAVSTGKILAMPGFDEILSPQDPQTKAAFNKAAPALFGFVYAPFLQQLAKRVEEVDRAKHPNLAVSLEAARASLEPTKLEKFKSAAATMNLQLSEVQAKNLAALFAIFTKAAKEIKATLKEGRRGELAAILDKALPKAVVAELAQLLGIGQALKPILQFVKGVTKQTLAVLRIPMMLKGQAKKLADAQKLFTAFEQHLAAAV